MSLIVQYMFGRNFTQFENSTEKRRHFVWAVSPVFGPLNISRLFRKLCQHQAHAVNHQLTKRGLSQQAKWHFAGKWYFPNKISPVSLFEYVLNRNYMYEKNQLIKWKRQKKNFFSSALFWTMVKPRTLVTLRLSVRCSFFSLSEHSQVSIFFGPGFALLYAVTYGVLYSNTKF